MRILISLVYSIIGIDLSKYDLIGREELPSPPLQYLVWITFFVNPARDKRAFNSNGTTSGDLTLLYLANASSVDNSTPQNFIESSFGVGKTGFRQLTHMIYFSPINNSYIIQLIEYEEFLSYYENDSYSGIRVEQYYNYHAIVLFMGFTYIYHQIFLLNNHYQIDLALFYFYYWQT